MRRSQLLVLAVVTVFVSSVCLRVRSHILRARERADVHTGPPGSQPDALPVPRDYVAEPWVAPQEANAGPRRIVSLAPSVTETLCALGLRDRIVGRTQYCLHPPGIETVPVVGAMLDTNLEMIQSLRPDLVLTTANSGPALDRLRELGLPHACVPHESLAELFAAIERLGELCDRPRTAAALGAAIRADLGRLEHAANAAGQPPRNVLIVLGSMPVPPGAVWVAGPGSFLDDLLRQAGHRNAAAGALLDTHGELSLERLLALRVDIILTFGQPLTEQQETDLYTAWSQFGELEAISHRRIRCVGGLEWLSAGPRIAITLQRIMACLNQPG